MIAEMPGQAAAWQRYLKEPLPGLKAFEEWRRTPISEWSLEQLAAPSAEKSRILVDGTCENVEALSFEEAGRDPRFEKVIKEISSSWLPPAYRKLELASESCRTGSQFLHIKKNARVETPVHIRVKSGIADFAFPRIIIFMDQGARASVVEEYGAEAFGNVSAGMPANALPREIALSALWLEAESSLRYFYLQDRPGVCVHFFGQNCRIKENAVLEHNSVFLGSRIHKSDVSVELAGAGAKAEISGALFGFGRQHFDYNSRQKHSAPNTSSRLLFDAAVAEEARSIYTGLIRIEGNAKNSEAYQANHNLMLSTRARADTTPILEILTDAVRCKHGATAGSLDADDIFYAATRGLSPEQAKELLVSGFFSAILSKLPEGEIAARLERRIQERLSLPREMGGKS